MKKKENSVLSTSGQVSCSMTETLQIFDTNTYQVQKNPNNMHLSLKNKTQIAQQYVKIEFSVV